MKMNFKYIFSAVVVSVMATACIGDLDTTPLDDRTVTSESAYGAEEAGYVQGLTKVYAQFASNNTKDLIVDDGGSSELIRTFWSTQEITTDACKVGWGNDSWAQDLNRNTWTAQHNHMIYSVYVRTLQGVAYANEYLRQTSDANLSLRGCSDDVKEKVQGYRAEARFLRAFFYWAAMDTFGQVPFSTEDSPFGGGYNPPQTPAAEIFKFVESELLALAADGSDMPAAQSNYPRADKGSVLGLLARLYLNAEVYTGTERWADAKATCEKIFALGYKLAPTHAELFRGDNGENPDAKGEFLFAASYNAEHTQSYGGTGYLTFAAIAATDVNDEATGSFVAPTGINNGWGGIRVPDPYVQTYFSPAAYDFEAGTYSITDKRGHMFNIKGQTQEMDLYVFKTGWKCMKYNNYPHNKGPQDADALNTARSKSYSDIDFPLIRLGEIHLIYAEACMHAGGDASAQVAALAERAGVAAPAAIDADFLMAERARELMWEAHRRTDLIRYGKWISGYNWTFKGGNFNANPETYVVAGYEVTENSGTYTVAKPAALQALETALAKGGNVTLANDVTLLESIKVENKVVLDLNGKTITAPLFSAFEVKAGGELTVKNGKVVAYESTVRAIGGKVTVESGEYTSTGTALDSPATYRYSLDCREGGELIINGGTFKSNNGMINVGSTVTINGGKFENIVEKTMTRHFAYVSAPLTINDGEFYGKANNGAGGCFFCGAAADGKIIVNGGCGEYKR